MNKSHSNIEKQKIANNVSIVSIVINLALSIGKFLAGLVGHSAALISDAIHSASDVISTIIVIIGIRFSNKDADIEHEYGHERMECLASIILAILLFLTSAGIGIQGVKSIVTKEYTTAITPGISALIAAGISIIAKELMYQVTAFYAKRINSSALMADAWHHRSDSLSSIGSLIGIFAARHGMAIADPIASIVICIFIAEASISIFKDAASQLLDNSCGSEVEEEMKNIALSIDGVIGVDLIHTRKFGTRVYVDMEVSADGSLTLYESHIIAEEVHDSIEDRFDDVKHCMVHMNPAKT